MPRKVMTKATTKLHTIHPTAKVTPKTTLWKATINGGAAAAAGRMERNGSYLASQAPTLSSLASTQISRKQT